MIVVDNSVVVSLLLGDGPHVTTLQERLDGRDVVVPELLDLEAVSAFRHLAHTGEITAAAATEAVAALDLLPFERIGHRALVHRVWELREDVTPYDAAYVAIAELLGAPLVTLDARLARSPGIRCAVELIR